MRTLPLLENRKSGGDKVKDFLGEGDYQPTGQGEETLRTLGGIMALEGQTDLYDTPAQQDHTDGTNQGENECGKVVYYSERIAAGCKGSSGKAFVFRTCSKGTGLQTLGHGLPGRPHR